MNYDTVQWLAAGVLRASWQASVLAVLIVLLQRVMVRRISARVRYGLWTLVVLRLALPVGVASPVSFRNYLRVERPTVVPVMAPPVAVANVNIAPTLVNVPVGKSIAFSKTVSWGERLAMTWAIGTGVGLCLVLVGSVRLARHVRRLRRVEDPRVIGLLKSCAAEVGVRRPPLLLAGAEAGGPALAGFVRPVLLLPEGVLKFEDDALRMILLHELAHQKRGDVPANWILALLQCVHWFNPVVHLAFARVRADRELACDERVLSLSKSAADRPAYGRTIVRLVESLSPDATSGGRLPVPAVGILEGRHQLKRRIAMIAEHRPVRRAWSLVALVVGSLVAAVACTEGVRGGDAPKVNVTVVPAEPAAVAPAQPPAQPGLEAPAPDAAPPAPGAAGRLTLNTSHTGTLNIAGNPDPRLTKRLPQLKLDSIPLSDALAFVKDSAGLNVFVDRRALEAAGIDLDSPVTLDLKDITVEQAFRLIGRSAAPTGVELGATADGDVIVFGVHSNAPAGPVPQPFGVPGGFGGVGPEGGYVPTGQGQSLVIARKGAAERAITQVYDVDAICGKDPEKLNTLVQVLLSSLKVDKSSALVALQPFNGKLVVTATPDLHERLVELMTMLKESAPAQASAAPAPVHPPAPTNSPAPR